MFSFKPKFLLQSAPRIYRNFNITIYNCENQLPKECQVLPVPTAVISTPETEQRKVAQENPVEISKQQPRVIIVGAGIAGLSAAKRLMQIGFRNFRVLEATERPGGRVDSRWLGDIVADLGAQWTEDLNVIPPALIAQLTDAEPTPKIEPPVSTVPESTLCIPPGYVGGVTPLLRGLPEHSVSYKKPVTKIRWNIANEGTKGALVKCADGEELAADFVIVTVSLGFLKTHAEQLFEPALTKLKLDAIKNLGFDVVDKVFMEFETPFKEWHKEEHLCYYWDTEELAKEKDWAKGIRVIEKCENSQHVLHAVVAGPDATAMELASDKDVAAVITRVLGQVSSNQNIPLPKTLLRSRWSTDQYFCGAHSFMDRDSKVQHQIHLADSLPSHNQPTPPVLLFAGEATSPGHFGTVQGARISGIREAERVGHLTKKLADGLKSDALK